MNPKEAGFLLLTSHLGNPERKPLTVHQFMDLARRMGTASPPKADRELDLADLISLGYGKPMAERILSLLAEEEMLTYYLQRGTRLDCMPLSRIHPSYPHRLRLRLGLDAPGCLWVKGDVTLLNTPMISLVGSRNLGYENRSFAENVGYQAARQGYTLVSGNARGADRAAQDACLAAGGNVISIVADELSKQPLKERTLYLSEDDFDAPFSAQRALSRNRCIHALSGKTFVAQCGAGKGGTWDGTVKNLLHNWSPVFMLEDGSEASRYLAQYGANLISKEDLLDLSSLKSPTDNFLTGSE